MTNYLVEPAWSSGDAA